MQCNAEITKLRKNKPKPKLMLIKKRKLQWAAQLVGEDALHRRSRGRHGTGGARGGAARSGGGAVGGGEVRRNDGRPGALLCLVALAIGAGKEGNSGEVLAAHQGSKCEKKHMGSKRGARRSWWRSLLPVGACGEVRRATETNLCSIRFCHFNYMG